MNCATHGQITLNKLVKEINIFLNKEINPIYGDIRAGDIKHSFAAIDLIKKTLNYLPTHLFRDGLKCTIESYI